MVSAAITAVVSSMIYDVMVKITVSAPEAYSQYHQDQL